MSDNLGDRMKMYESAADARLLPRVPVIIRIDGKAFHTLTKGMDRPWDERLAKCMQETTRFLAHQLEGCKLAYTQSDEMSFLLTDWERYGTQAWFQYRVQKMTSVAASLAASVFMQLAAVDIELFGKSLTQFPDEQAVTHNKRLRTIRKLKRVL